MRNLQERQGVRYRKFTRRLLEPQQLANDKRYQATPQRRDKCWFRWAFKISGGEIKPHTITPFRHLFWLLCSMHNRTRVLFEEMVGYSIEKRLRQENSPQCGGFTWDLKALGRKARVKEKNELLREGQPIPQSSRAFWPRSSPAVPRLVCKVTSEGGGSCSASSFSFTSVWDQYPHDLKTSTISSQS